MSSLRPKESPSFKTRMPTLTIALTIALFSTVNHARALEGKALLDKLLAENAAKEKITWTGLTEQTPDSFTLSGVKIMTRQEQPATIEKLVVQGFRETDDGYLQADGLTASNLASVSKDQEILNIQSIQSSKLKIPGEFLTRAFTDQKTKGRISFEGFILSNLAISHSEGSAKLDSLKISNADLPLSLPDVDPKQADTDIPAPATMGTFDLNNLSGSSNGVDWSLGSIALANASLPVTGVPSEGAFNKFYSSASVNNFAASLAGAELVKIDSLASNFDDADSEGTTKGTSLLEGLMINLKAIPDPRTREIASQLGYDKVEGSMTGNVSYNTKAGRYSADNVSLKLKDMADLAMSYAITGYTQEAAQAYQAAQMEIANGKPPAEAYTPRIAVLSKILLEGFMLKITDQSLTGKVLDFQGQQMGTTGDELAEGAPMMLGMGLAGLQMPEFTEMVTSAVGNFLTNKGSLTIETKLDKPVSIVETVVAGQINPKSVPELLKLQITGD